LHQRTVSHEKTVCSKAVLRLYPVLLVMSRHTLNFLTRPVAKSQTCVSVVLSHVWVCLYRVQCLCVSNSNTYLHTH